MRQSLKIIVFSCLLVAGFFAAGNVLAATEFTSIVDPDNGAGTSWTSLSAWEAATQVDLSTTTATKVYSFSSASGTFAVGSALVGYTSGATASSTYRTATQVLIYNISGIFQSGETVYIQGQASTTNYVVLSNTGDSAIAVASVRSTSGSADTTAVIINGWTTSATNYIKIWTDPSLGNRHNGKWDDTKYRMESDASAPIDIFENYLRIDGLQIYVYSGVGYYAINNGYGNTGSITDIRASNNIIRGDGLSSNYHVGIMFDMQTSATAVARAWNNIIYDLGKQSSTEGIDGTNGTLYIYNNTINNARIGISGGGTFYAKNNIVQDVTNGYSGTFDLSSDYNISSLAGDTTGGAHDKASTTVTFADLTNKDFHLSPTDTAARNAGTSTVLWDANLSFTQDIDGSYRGAAWDIGADEVPTEFVSTICENTSAGGDCANRNFSTLSTWEAGVNSDLTATSTRVFSGSASGTLAVGNAVTLYSGAVSLGISGTIKATTTNQILITGITGTTSPVNVASGTAWQVTAANTWKNSGTADQLGASPIAVAKIDGAWASADTATVDINGWTTSADNYVKVYTTSLARHEGKWNINKYRLDISITSDYDMALNTYADFTWIDGLQIKVSNNDYNGTYGIGVGWGDLNPGSKAYISNNIITENHTTTNDDNFSAISVRSSVTTGYIWNNLIYNSNQGGSGNGAGIMSYYNRHYVYNNTLYNVTGYGIRSNAGSVLAKNNILQNATFNSGSFNASSSNNISSDTSAPGTNSKINTIVNFISTSTADFHLADSDTSAKGAGVNLYGDANINVTNDIDSAARPATSTIGLNWDIGADQTAVKIYRSIAPSATGALTTGASNALTISSSTSLATFATALADNIGVGDVIIYNTSGTATGTAFIHSRSSSTVYTVKTASGTAPTAISADTSWSIYRAYISLSNAEAGIENTGVPSAMRNFDDWTPGGTAATDDVGRNMRTANEQWNIAAYSNGTTADTARTLVGSWGASAQNYLKIYTPYLVNEVGTSQRHQGKWDDNKYRIDYTAIDYRSTLYIGTNDNMVVKIDGLQISLNNNGSNNYGGLYINYLGSAAQVYVSNSIVRGIYSGSGATGDGIYNGDNYPSMIWNNIVYGFNTTNENCIYVTRLSYVYNNTVYNCATGIGGGYPTNTFYNNIAQNNTDGFAVGAGTSNYNLSDVASDAPGANSKNSTTVLFVDVIGKDFHLSPSDTAALDAGTSSPATDANLSFTDDIDGQVRRQWDIGADEGSVEYVTSVMESGGNFSSLSAWEAANQVDLTATTTAVFSLSSASGTIPASASVMGLTSGAVASTTVGSNSTSTQILLFNIASSTFQSGERVYIKGAATTSNYAILSNAGNPAIATAKIDGAWTSADTTAATISGWTTGPNNYVRVYTTPTARHNGKWDTGKYRLETASLADAASLEIIEEYVRIEGLQISYSRSGGGSHAGDIYVGVNGSIGASDIRISHSIMRKTGIDGNSWNNGVALYSGTVSRVYDNIIYDITSGGESNNAIDIGGNGPVAYVYNNTVYNSFIGFRSDAGEPPFIAKNNISYNNTDNYYGTFDASSTNNLSGPSQTDAPGSNSQNAKVVNFVDAANKDFHLAPTDTAAKDAGTSTVLWDANLSFTQDIDGSYRGAAWDIGADEVPTEFVSTICESASAGGGCATMDKSTLSSWESDVNSDLTATSTRVFSGSRTGTWADGATLTLYRGATSTGITGIVVATTSSQILLRSIAGTTTPLNVQNGDTWQLNGSNYWTASGTADQLGASPIAVAKIDGAWTAANTTGVSINGWTTSADNYIKIYTAILARHTGKWDTEKYRLEVTSNAAISIAEEFFWLDGIQLKTTYSGSSWPNTIWSSVNSRNSDIRISNNIVKASWNVSNSGYVLGNNYGDTVMWKIWNNIFSDITGGSGGTDTALSLTGGTIYVYNNTFVNGETCISQQSNAVVIAKNNITKNCTNGYGGTFATSSDYNISDIAGDAPNATFATTSKVVQFVSTSTADFHLADTDTSAKGAGVNLYNDANINVTNDIDSAARPPANVGLNWDIGADQTAVKIYRSIAPSATTALTTGSSNALIISSSTSLATFATALADNIGVGDVIIYNTGGTATGTAFISGRSSSTVYTVKTASGTAPTAISADTSWSIYRAYTSLSNAEAGTENTGIANATIRNFDAWSGGADLVASNTQMNIAAYANGTTADTDAVMIDGWTTGAQNYIKIYTPTAASEVGTSQRHQGKWDDGKYDLIKSSSGGNALVVQNQFTQLDGLQIDITAGNLNAAILLNTNNLRFSNSIIRAANSYGSGIRFTTVSGINVWNNKIYGFSASAGSYSINTQTGTATSSVYNNTIWGGNAGIYGYYSENVILKNNIVQNATDGYFAEGGGSPSFNSASDYNISDLASDASGSNSKNSTVVSFVDAANKDFHLSPTDTAALDAGTSTPATDTNLSFTDDIDGQLRRQWDIGADEGSVEYVTSVMQSGGNFSTLSAWEAANQVDLTATTTAVFSLSSASGTIPVNSSVMGLTSGAVASTTVGSVSTSTQILLYNIASSTFLSGERIYIKGGATTSNYAILSNAGNPAIATAKIDGAWTGADTTAVTINGWTTGPNNYVRIYTTSAARHQGKWDDGKYRLEVTSATGIIAINIGTEFTRIDGLQLKAVGSLSANGYKGIGNSGSLNSGASIQVSNNIIQGVLSGSVYGYGIDMGYYTSGANRTWYIWNNIIYGFNMPASNGIRSNTGGTVYTSAYISNNTAYGNMVGIEVDLSYVLKNNIAYNNTFDYFYTANASSTNNLSRDGTAPNFGTYYINTNVSFVDAANKDFHLAPTDTAAKDAGIDLSTLTTLPFYTDIDGQYRGAEATSTAGGLGWDIGADEGATIMYRSVGNDTSNLNTGGATVTIASTTATFNTALATNIGVGDVIQYGNPLTLAFITGRSSSTVYSIVSATGSLPVATTTASTSIYRAHTLLNNWQTQTTGTVNQSINSGLRSQVLVARNLVASNTAMFVSAYASTSPDTTAVTIDNWTTGIANYIRIYTPNSANEVGASQRHQGKWDDSKYRLEVTAGADYTYPIQIADQFVKIDGLQILLNGQSCSWCYGVSSSNLSAGANIYVLNNIIRATNLTGTPQTAARGISFADGDGTYYIWNNIVYDFNGTGVVWNSTGITHDATSSFYVFNNTITNSRIGFLRNNTASGTFIAKNNLSYNNTDNYYGTFSASSTNNLSGPTQSDAPGSNPQNAKVVEFINTASSSYDFHLAPTDRAARDAGVSLAGDPYLPFTIDIDGNTRPQGPGWDIGADEATDVPEYRFNGFFKLKGFFNFR